MVWAFGEPSEPAETSREEGEISRVPETNVEVEVILDSFPSDDMAICMINALSKCGNSSYKTCEPYSNKFGSQNSCNDRDKSGAKSNEDRS